MIDRIGTMLLILSLLGTAGCDYVDDPLVTPTDGNGGGEGVTRKVLLEDFTGHRCNNCPRAARKATELQAVYGEDLIVVGVHCTYDFAAPADPPNANGSYSTDFRTPAGDAYELAFGINALPLGAVNRTPFNNSLLLGDDAWSSAVFAQMGQEADLDIWFSRLEHDAVNNTVTAEVSIAVLNPVIGDHKMVVYLTEDRVVDWQYDAAATPPDVEDYEHRHVLRTNLNGTWGEELFTGGAAPGDTITLLYEDFPMDDAWVAPNCALVAYAYNVGTDEVIQVEERKFQP